MNMLLQSVLQAPVDSHAERGMGLWNAPVLASSGLQARCHGGESVCLSFCLSVCWSHLSMQTLDPQAACHGAKSARLLVRLSAKCTYICGLWASSML